MKRRAILRSLLCGVALAASSHLSVSQERPPTTGANTTTYTSAVVSVLTDGEVYFGRDRITQAEIPDRIKEVFKDKPQSEQIIYIRAGLNVSYTTIVSVIEMIRGAGFDQIALVPNTDYSPTLRTRSPARDAGKDRKIHRRRHINRKSRNDLAELGK
jgi:biopolymer transport protein ExbD